MARIKIETPFPANTELGDAMRAARLAACDALSIHVVEQETKPVTEKMTGEDGEEKISPNDHTVDRILVTYWDMIGGSR